VVVTLVVLLGKRKEGFGKVRLPYAGYKPKPHKDYAQYVVGLYSNKLRKWIVPKTTRKLYYNGMDQRRKTKDEMLQFDVLRLGGAAIYAQHVRDNIGTAQGVYMTLRLTRLHAGFGPQSNAYWDVHREVGNLGLDVYIKRLA
jgi:hypothetical protein